jgi:phage-related tail protein
MELIDAYGKAKDVVADISEHLGSFFKAHQQLEKHVHEEELKTKKARDPELSVNQEAFNRIMAQKEMQRLETELREMMVYQAPKELGAIWSEFEAMRDRVKTERAEVQRQQLYKQQVSAWRQANIKRKIKEQLTSILAVLFIILWFLWIMILIRTSETYRSLYSSPYWFCVLC